MVGMGLPMDIGLAGRSGAGSPAAARDGTAHTGGSVFDGLLAGTGGKPRDDGSSRDPVAANAPNAPDEAVSGAAAGLPIERPAAEIAPQETDMAAGRRAGTGTSIRAGDETGAPETEDLTGKPGPDFDITEPAKLPMTGDRPSGRLEVVEGDGAQADPVPTPPEAAEDDAVAMAVGSLIQPPAAGPRTMDGTRSGTLEVPGLKAAALTTGDRGDPLRAASVDPDMSASPAPPASAMTGVVEGDVPAPTIMSGAELAAPGGSGMVAGIEQAQAPAEYGAQLAEHGGEAGMEAAIDTHAETARILSERSVRLDDARPPEVALTRDAGPETRTLSQAAATAVPDAAATFAVTGFEDAQGALQRLGLDMGAVAEQSARTARTASGRAARTEHQLLGSVGAALRRASVDETGRTTLTLRPQGLGLIEIEISKDQENRVHMSMRVQNPMVLDAIQSDRQLISGLLENNGRALSGFDLSGFDQGARDQAPDRRAPDRPGGHDRAMDADTHDTAEAAPTNTRTTPGGVDILI